MGVRHLKADLILTENIRALLHARGDDQASLAQWCGHKTPWINKILGRKRGVQIKDLGRIADFFGIQVADLFDPGLNPHTDRRKGVRRRAQRRASERRSPQDRRRAEKSGGLHPDVQPRFRPRPSTADDDEGQRRTG